MERNLLEKEEGETKSCRDEYVIRGQFQWRKLTHGRRDCAQEVLIRGEEKWSKEVPGEGREGSVICRSLAKKNLGKMESGESVQ